MHCQFTLTYLVYEVDRLYKTFTINEGKHYFDFKIQIIEHLEWIMIIIYELLHRNQDLQYTIIVISHTKCTSKRILWKQLIKQWWPKMSFNSNMTGVICGAGSAKPSEEPEFTSGFNGVCVVSRSLSLCVVFCKIVVCPFFYWPLWCRSFDLLLLITLLVLSILSCININKTNLPLTSNKGKNKTTEHRAIYKRERQNW